MYKLPKTGIEYADRSWNFYPGCLHKPQGKCPVTACWAEGMHKRQMGAARANGITLPDFHHPHLIPERLLAPLRVKKPSRILVNFMGDLFGDWVDPNIDIRSQGIPITVNGQVQIWQSNKVLKQTVLDVVTVCRQHTFIFLTKNPAGLAAWSPFPGNCWVGVSVSDDKMLDVAVDKLEDLTAKYKFISLEPLLARLTLSLDYAFFYSGINWLIIGQQTPVKASTIPEKIWIDEIIEAAKKSGISYFLKDNLRSIMGNELVQDFPKGVVLDR